jgi:hypothetical protein
LNPDRLIYQSGPNNRRLGLALYCGWLAIVLYLAVHHAVWRDEMRALSFALQGNNVFDMIRGVHGEGHPLLWYLLLRGSHALLATPRVLLIVSVVVAASAMLLLVLRSSFNLFILALLFLSRFAIYEYSVMARNYGISMLILFLLAAFYKRHRERSLLLGILLFLLANTNAHSVLLVVAFVIFWLSDLVLNPPAVPSSARKNFWLNTGIAVLGCILCAVTVRPTINDAAQIDPADRPHGLGIIKSVVLPAQPLSNAVPLSAANNHLHSLLTAHPGVELLLLLCLSLVILGSTLGLIRRPAALFGAWAGLGGFALFFTVIYPGDYRHVALWLVFLVTLYWIAGDDQSRPAQPAEAKPSFQLLTGAWSQRIRFIGYLCFIFLLMFQAFFGVQAVQPVLRNTKPESRVRDLAALISSIPSLHDATVIGDPDYLVEAIPYYLPNPTYLIREHRYGNIVIFTRRATLTLSLSDILANAQDIHRRTGKPVIVLLNDRLDTVTTPQRLKEGYDWILTTTPEEIQTFKQQTRLLSHFGPASGLDETFDAYVID